MARVNGVCEVQNLAEDIMLRTFFVASTMWGLTFFAAAGRCFAGASDRFELAQNREKDGYFRQAERAGP